MVFRARKSVRLLAAAGAAATPSFGVGTSRAAAATAPTPAPPVCGMRFDPVLHGGFTLAACDVRVAQPFGGTEPPDVIAASPQAK
jgi:hypothetical protein